MLKRIVAIGLLVVGMMSFSGCSSSVDAGYEGVVVKQPLFLGHGGVDETPIKTGLVWHAATTTIIPVNVRPFNVDEQFNDMITADNNPVDFAIHMTFKHIEGQTPILYEKFGDDWYKSKIKEPLRTDVRNFVKKESMFSISTDPKVSDNLEVVIESKVRAFIKTEKIPTELVNVTVGKVMPPDSVIKATEETAAQRQRVLTQEATVKAEQAREIAQRATAQADKAYMHEMAMTPAQYLKNKELDIIREKKDVKVFIGTMPQPVVMN